MTCGIFFYTSKFIIRYLYLNETLNSAVKRRLKVKAV